MDPLSLAASVAGLLSLAAQVISAGYKLCSKMSTNAGDLEMLVNETAAFSGILLGVKSHLESRPPVLADLDLMDKMTQDSKTTLKEIDHLLDKMASASRLMVVVKGEGREERLEKLVRRIGQHKLFFILCFQLEQSSQSYMIQRKMEDVFNNLTSIVESQSKIEKAVSTLVDSEELKQREKMIQWLGPATDTDHEDLCKRRDSESADWILGRNEFGSWISSGGSSFLWLNGIQGSGKSIIVSKIIGVIQETNLGSNDSALVYHYCRFSNLPTLDPCRLVGSFIGQLLRQTSNSDIIMGPISKLYEKHQRTSTHPSLEDLQSLFMELSQYFQRVFLIIDGLDEVPDRWSILEFLENLSRRDEDFKVLVASRAEMDLEDAFSFYAKVTIEPRDIAPDIERFVRKQLSRRRFRGSEVEEIVKELVIQADGMFLWVVCQIDHLFHVRRAITPSLLKALPRNLERTFEQTFSKLQEEDRILAKRILQFIMLASTPLDLSELVEGIAVTPDATSLDDVRRNKLGNYRDVFEICGSLIRESQSTGKIELAHYSVYQFLKSPVLEGSRQNILYLDDADGNVELLQACTRYLSIDGVCTTGLPAEVEQALGDEDTYFSPDMFANTPFLEHAVSNWPAYVLRLEQAQLKHIWGSVLLPFFQPSTKYFDFWAKTARYIHGRHKYPPGMMPLHATAVHGLVGLADLLMTDAILQRAPWQPRSITTGSRTPLHIAIENGREAMFDMFIIPNYVQSTDEIGRTPLHVALESGNELAVTQLVSAGANVNLPEQDGRTPIFIAIENTWEDLATLLSKIADPAIKMPDGRGLLHLAAQTGSTVWMSSLLEYHDGLINDEDQRGWTPLLYAADGGFGGVVKILLSKEACTGIPDSNGWTALHAAIRHKHSDCAYELLTSKNLRLPLIPAGGGHGPHTFGSNISQREREQMDRKYGRTTRGGNSGAGASTRGLPQPPSVVGGSSSSVSGQSLSAPSPMMLAVSNNFLAGVEMLLKHSESYVGLLGVTGECLKEAVSLPDKAILEALLPASNAPSILAALPNMAERTDDRALNSMRQKLDVTLGHKILLPEAISDHRMPSHILDFLLNVWPLSSTTLPDNVLHLASRRPITEGTHLAARLIEGGADTLFVDSEGHTPLQAAIHANNWDVVELFASKGMADAKVAPYALHFVAESAQLQADGAEEKVISIATMLHENGIDIDCVDQIGHSICHKAAAREDSVLLRWALENNAYPALADSRGDTPVHMAVAFSRTENLHLLLSSIIQLIPEELVPILATPGLRKPPLLLATEVGNVAVLKALIEADQMAKCLEEVDDPSYHSLRLTIFTNALCNAIRKGFDNGVELLIEAMSFVSGLSSTGETPLHVAVKHERSDVVRKLLEHGAYVNAQEADSGKTPYSIAVAGSMASILTILFKFGAELQPSDIMMAAEGGDKALLEEILIKYPDDLEGQMKALFTARNLKHTGVVNALLAKAASRPEQLIIEGVLRDAYGDTVLHQAVRSQNKEKVRDIAFNGDGTLLHAKDAGGDSALMVAIRICHWGSAEILAEAGANIAQALKTAVAEQCDMWIDKLNELSRRYPSSNRGGI
ncbi:ankyrin repeat-containing domain protein [Dactylonectria macrodidyma]|uniref:Ankyrin repeat-containing domain protein n=1 Tax=Dactylonectria macrodidyma TaxID=307937 RepID=A0A9P9EXA1_9HYPO|nr:ankyrin repeat-containing domain protein [Dactylonectria macrodidyma]